jgi:hypothetical protein
LTGGDIWTRYREKRANMETGTANVVHKLFGFERIYRSSYPTMSAKSPLGPMRESHPWSRACLGSPAIMSLGERFSPFLDANMGKMILISRLAASCLPLSQLGKNSPADNRRGDGKIVTQGVVFSAEAKILKRGQ